jgi:hypothetical protein
MNRSKNQGFGEDMRTKKGMASEYGNRVRVLVLCGPRTCAPARLFLVEIVELRGFLMEFLRRFHEFVAGD